MTRLDLSNSKTASSTNSMFFKAEILFLEKDSGGDSKKGILYPSRNIFKI